MEVLPVEANFSVEDPREGFTPLTTPPLPLALYHVEDRSGRARITT
jgi:hypothetical protein